MKVVFLDRDGTVILEPPDERVDSVEKIQLFPDTIEALSQLAKRGFSAILITNQVGIAEDRISQKEFEVINAEVINKLQPSGINILKTYVCPHSPEDACECRKSKPTMILRAAKEFNIDLSQSYMVGDRLSDIMAGVNAGTKTILVQTGNNPVISDKATYTAANLLEAVKYIVDN